MAKPIFSNLDNLSLQDIESEAELIPLLTSEDEEALEKEDLPVEVSLLPLRNTVLFPGVVIPITVGRDKSIQLIKDANKGSKVIGVVAQKDQAVENPGSKDIYNLGTVAQILRVLKMPDGNTTIIIQGKKALKGTVHRVIPDRIEVGTYMIAGALSGDQLTISNIDLEHVQNVLNTFKSLGVNLNIFDNKISISKTNLQKSIDLQTEEYPGFPTDLQAQIMVLMTKANGISRIKENIFENRFMHVSELRRLGAKIEMI